jgi:hypothetical protein
MSSDADLDDLDDEEDAADAVPKPAPGARGWKIITALLAVFFIQLAALTAMLLFSGGKSAADATATAAADAGANASGKPAKPAAPAPTGPFARFISRDDKRAGDWKKDLGKDGYVVFNKNGAGNHEVKLPAYVQEVTSSATHYVWSTDVNEKRGLEDPGDAKVRHSTCEYADSEMTIKIVAKRPTPYRLSIYSLDFDRLGRAYRLEMMVEDRILHTQEVPNLGEGTWLHYDIVGSIDLHFINIGAANAVVAGIFFDGGVDRIVPRREPPTGAPASEAALKPGLRAEYFDDLAEYANIESKATLVTTAKSLKFGTMSPPQHPNQFLRGWPFSGACAAIFSGFVKIEQAGPHTFTVESDDGAKLYIDGELVVDNDGIHTAKEVSGQRELTAGYHRIFLEYYNAGGSMTLNASMQRKDGEKAPLGAQLFYE